MSVDRTIPIIHMFRHLHPVMLIHCEQCGNRNRRQLWCGFSGCSTRSYGCGRRLKVVRRVGTVCDDFSGSTEATTTSSGADSLAEGRGMRDRDVSGSDTDILSSARTGPRGRTMSGPR